MKYNFMIKNEMECIALGDFGISVEEMAKRLQDILKKLPSMDGE